MDTSKALSNWTHLNRTLMKGSEKVAHDLLKAEQDGACRPAFLRRIHSRLNRLRARRERSHLVPRHRRLRDRSDLP